MIKDKDKEILIEIGIRSKYRHHVTKQEKCSLMAGWLTDVNIELVQEFSR